MLAPIVVDIPSSRGSGTGHLPNRARGSSHPRAVLTVDAVRAIRLALAGRDRTITELAREYGASVVAVSGAAYGRTWAHVTDPPPLREPGIAGRRATNVKLTAASVGAARIAAAAGDPQSVIAARFGVSNSAIYDAIHGLTWAYVTDPPPLSIREVGGRELVIKGRVLERVLRWRAAGMTMDAIAIRIGTTSGTVSRALSRRGDT